MKASELRSGNLLKGESLSIPRLQMYGDGITAISAYGIHLIESGQDIQLEPIPLTEEWLLKAGAKKQENGIWYLIEFDHAHTRGSFGVNCITGSIQIGDDVMTQAMKSCKYVHQLQNLYFALTGEELTISK